MKLTQGINDVLATTTIRGGAMTAIGNMANMTWLGETQMNVWESKPTEQQT